MRYACSAIESEQWAADFRRLTLIRGEDGVLSSDLRSSGKSASKIKEVQTWCALIGR
jgi:hypothetical protein